MSTGTLPYHYSKRSATSGHHSRHSDKTKSYPRQHPGKHWHGSGRVDKLSLYVAGVKNCMVYLAGVEYSKLTEVSSNSSVATSCQTNTIIWLVYCWCDNGEWWLADLTRRLVHGCLELSSAGTPSRERFDAASTTRCTVTHLHSSATQIHTRTADNNEIMRKSFQNKFICPKSNITPEK